MSDISTRSSFDSFQTRLDQLKRQRHRVIEMAQDDTVELKRASTALVQDTNSELDSQLNTVAENAKSSIEDTHTRIVQLNNLSVKGGRMTKMISSFKFNVHHLLKSSENDDPRLHQAFGLDAYSDQFMTPSPKTLSTKGAAEPEVINNQQESRRKRARTASESQSDLPSKVRAPAANPVSA